MSVNICLYRLQEEDMVNRTRLMQVESNKRAVEGELEATRRRLEQSEGGREALLSQIGKTWFRIQVDMSASNFF